MTSDAPGATYLNPMLNPFEPGFFDDPYRQYAEVREHDPVHRTPIGAWAVFRYDDVVRVLRDPTLSVEERHLRDRERFVHPNPVIRARIEQRSARGNRAMLNLDPPDHHRLRRLVAKVFTPRMVESLRPRVQQLVEEHLDAVSARGGDRMDVIADLAFPLPFVVISEMLGVPEGRDRLQLREWSGALVKTFDPILTDDEWIAAFDASDNLLALVHELIGWKRAHLADDLLSALIEAEDEGDRLDEQELVAQTTLLYVAGHETTVNLIGNGMLALLRHRGQLELLQQDPTLDANAVDELLRYDSPVQMSRRIARAPLEIDGRVIEAGAAIMTCLASANRDPRKWGETADALDLRRADAPQHMSFGGGVHSCLGAHLARLEGQLAIGSLVRRFPLLDLATDAAAWNGRVVLRGLTELPLTLGAVR